MPAWRTPTGSRSFKTSLGLHLEVRKCCFSSSGSISSSIISRSWYRKSLISFIEFFLNPWHRVSLPISSFYSPWYYTQKRSGRHKMKSTLWWVGMVCLTLVINQTFLMWMPCARRCCDGKMWLLCVSWFKWLDNQDSYILAAVSHAVTEDDVYKGFFIPKGSVIVENIW